MLAGDYLLLRRIRRQGLFRLRIDSPLIPSLWGRAQEATEQGTATVGAFTQVSMPISKLQLALKQGRESAVTVIN